MLRRTATALAVFALLAGQPALAGITPQQKCALMKLTACGKKLGAKLACYGKGKVKALPVDPACLTRAETKFDAAMVKAGNACPGTALELEAAVDAGVAVLLGDVPGDGKCPAKTTVAAGKAGKGLLSCEAKAVRMAPTALPLCDAKNSTKLATAVQKAGACADAGVIDADVHRVDSAIGAIIDGTVVANTTTTLPAPTTSTTTPDPTTSTTEPESTTTSTLDTTTTTFTTTTFTTTTTIPVCGPVILEWGHGEIGTAVDVAVDNLGNVFVADAIAAKIHKYTDDGTFISSWNTTGLPDRVAVDGSGHVFVAESLSSIIEEFSNTGMFITSWAGVSRPGGIGIDGAGNVFVSSSTNNVIQKFTNTGTPTAQWGGPGTGDGEFDVAGGIAVDAGGNVYVLDDTNRIQVFTNNGTFVRAWDAGGSAGVAVDGASNVYVTARSMTRKFDVLGTLLAEGPFGGAGISVDLGNNIFVADYLPNSHVQKFACP